jgi:hypothetical protein
VLLGGSFWQARDHHVTPVGDLSGVEVLAQILETELEGGGPRGPKTWELFVIQCLAGFGIVAAFHRRGLKSAVGLSLGVSALAAPVASFFVFRTWTLWFYFLPALGAWLVQQLYDKAKEYRDELLLGSVTAPSDAVGARDAHDERFGVAEGRPAANLSGEPRPSSKRGKKRRNRGRAS